MQARAHLFITGRVQGVYYRGFTRDVASELRLKGWVRNLPDGRVEALFEGTKEDIELAIQRCFSGPPGARVDGIDAQWEDSRGDIQDFQVLFY
ncbi:MAG TPA: acylphosphatase [Nitrospiraceae bacterium]|jgi:acylphosphatase|nr:acylphosphatase [Nitrospiraceae bacterium]